MKIESTAVCSFLFIFIFFFFSIQFRKFWRVDYLQYVLILFVIPRNFAGQNVCSCFFLFVSISLKTKKFLFLSCAVDFTCQRCDLSAEPKKLDLSLFLRSKKLFQKFCLFCIFISPFLDPWHIMNPDKRITLR